ncbi:MAG: hypothetical protein RLZZ71_913 [Bacteroidota bacterium]|jgi:hypothetical protein
MMEASLSGVVKIILWLLFLSAAFRFFIRLTASYAVNKVNEEVKRNQRAESNSQKTKSNASRGNKTPDSEYVDFVEIKDQD